MNGMQDIPIGERIKLYRRRRGLSQPKLAQLIGRSESWLSQVERGVRSVDRLSPSSNCHEFCGCRSST
jgi:transcriptional regulator with XRE-family HTH domain